MTTSLHRGTPANKPIDPTQPSPGQQALVANFAAARALLETLSLRASRLNGVRPDANEAAAIKFLRCVIYDGLNALDRAARMGGTLKFTYTSEHGPVLTVVAPPAQVIEIKPYLERGKLA